MVLSELLPPEPAYLEVQVTLVLLRQALMSIGFLLFQSVHVILKNYEGSSTCVLILMLFDGIELKFSREIIIFQRRFRRDIKKLEQNSP